MVSGSTCCRVGCQVASAVMWSRPVQNTTCSSRVGCLKLPAPHALPAHENKSMVLLHEIPLPVLSSCRGAVSRFSERFRRSLACTRLSFTGSHARKRNTGCRTVSHHALSRKLRNFLFPNERYKLRKHEYIQACSVSL